MKNRNAHQSVEPSSVAVSHPFTEMGRTRGGTSSIRDSDLGPAGVPSLKQCSQDLLS